MDPGGLWRQWYDMTFGMWTNLLGGNEQPPTNPFALYQQWLDSLQEARKPLEEDSAGITNFYETWQRWTEAMIESWRRAAEAGTRMARLATPRWAEMAEEAQKQMLDGGNLPADPVDFYTRWYSATSGPLSKLTDDILRDEAFLESSKRLLDYYATFNAIYRRASEEYFSTLQLPTSSDLDRVAKLVVALDDRNDRVEEMMEELEHGYEKQSTATDALEKRLERVESRLDQLDRVEEKLDRLLAAQSAAADGGQ
jgi:hypothetical protein